MRLKDKVVIVTGGASGIGEASARLFAQEGAKVVVADINMEKAEAIAEKIREDNQDSIAVHCDVSNESHVCSLIENTITTFKQLDILFNNAGIILPKRLEEIETAEWNRLFDVNIKSIYLTIKYAIPHLKQTQGNIINMASMTGVIGQRSNAAYSASKGAVIALTKAAAIDYAPFNVRVNAICPAGVKTPLLESWFETQHDPEKARLEQDLSHMLGRTASTEEIARAALFLASEEASFVTGVALPVEGGATLGYGAGIKPEWEYFNHSTDYYQKNMNNTKI
ncbi:NAD(P)-dependent dehydrogenase (short-subunit alcohol dehydrogenase family) [Caldalkalibacillus uzonensis]|uniref:NAD(P)-dependent dehydrogenase (Short-subunit alcohol dehydrogenase family) n=1 Tax=Caldalkalibacillus uzonensis TaxID=353224 RepID=A0ABU0CPK0_9BACI|nr:SDR family NAD(P)-dependent oxidoreductase [Caldalkalibacillus uzonensis]MDQ0338330.1 NAD(P)-dependent dehydrogenase (short-subunit alcohol dehydrogenase family) [Caldalkalibacillus uzonensis]